MKTLLLEIVCVIGLTILKLTENIDLPWCIVTLPLWFYLLSSILINELIKEKEEKDKENKEDNKN